MPKGKFSASDVRAMVRDLRESVLSWRVANVYDLDARTYLVKLAMPGVGEKKVLLLESGVRFHLTAYERRERTTELPSPFAMKLRKHVRAKRLEDVRQLGQDRVVDLRFGSGEHCAHLLLELYAGGNLLLTDHTYTVLALLRAHKFADGAEAAVHRVCV